MGYINVTVYDSTENKRVPAELPDDAPCNKIVAVLVQKLQLPVNGPDGAPLSYKFHHKNSGRQIQDGRRWLTRRPRRRCRSATTGDHGGITYDADRTAAYRYRRAGRPL